MKSELFLIEVLCEETGAWIEMETSRHPYPVRGGDADNLVSTGSLYRWLVIKNR